MLQSLHISNFILIKKLDLDFNKGFCVITGNTGAGKSILLDSILFCLGGKISGNLVNPDAESCSVTTVFTVNNIVASYLEEIGIEIDSEIIVKRIQNQSGRKKFLINDQIVTIRVIQKLFDYLLEIHGQHNHTLLINSNTHIEVLDEYGQVSSLKNELSNSYKTWQELLKKTKELVQEKANIEQEIDCLTHICVELKEAQIEIGEEQKLIDIKRIIQNRDKEINSINSILTEIESSSIEKIIARSQRALSVFRNSDNKLNKVNDDLEVAYDKIEDAKSTLSQILQDFNYNDQSLEEIEDRLYEIRNLARKHSCRPDELANFLQKSEERLSFLEEKLNNSSNLQNQADASEKHYYFLAKKLSDKRISVAKKLEYKTTQELNKLEMKKASFIIEIDSSEKYATSKGIDHVRFIASTNPGMMPSPVDKIASGGELSRFMLALRVALFDKTPKQSIIFDEIDVGISGSVADAIGERLKLLSKATQIIVITHQPQVAGKADQHILVEKTQHDSHTNVYIRSLDNNSKPVELARMISGKQITETAIEAAKELIN